MEIFIYTWEEREKKEIFYNEKNVVLFNDKIYQFVINTTLEDEDLSMIDIIIEEGITRIDYLNRTSKSIRTQFKEYFQKSFGISKIKIGEIVINLEIQTSQLLKEEANRMVDYIFQKDRYQIVAAVSDSSIQVQEKNNNYYESSLNRLKKLNDFLMLAENQFESFFNFSQSKTYRKDIISDYSKANIDDKSIAWVFNNLDRIEIRNFSNGRTNSIKLGRKYGYIDKILSKSACVNFNVYENQIILGVFAFIEKELEKIEYHFCARFIQNKKINPKYHSFEILSKNMRAKTRSELKLVKNNFISVSFKYKNLFKNVIPLNHPPKPTQVFVKVMHYKFLFIAIKNIRESTLNLDGDNPLLNIKNIHKLYELFNYHLILEIITESLRKNEFKVNHQDFDHELFRKISFFNDDDISLNFYYEPKIKKNSGRLDVGNLIPVLNNKENVLTPDFVIEFVNGDEFKYLVIDAKFSNLKNVKNNLLPKLSQNYVLGLRKKSKPFSLIEHLILIYPGNSTDKKYIEYFNEDSPTSVSIISVKVNEDEFLKAKIQKVITQWIKESFLANHKTDSDSNLFSNTSQEELVVKTT